MGKKDTRSNGWVALSEQKLTTKTNTVSAMTIEIYPMGRSRSLKSG